jgi:hypothetical protein
VLEGPWWRPDAQLLWLLICQCPAMKQTVPLVQGLVQAHTTTLASSARATWPFDPECAYL